MIKVESEQLVAGESVLTMGTLDLVQPSVLHLNVPDQVVLAQALLRAQATVVDGLNLEQEDQTLEKGVSKRRRGVCTWREWWEER